MAVSRFNPDYPDAGLTLLNKTDFTGASTVSVDNVFNADYKNYLVMLTCTNSTTGNGTFNFRTGGVDNTSSAYSRSGMLTYSNSSVINAYNGESEGTANVEVFTSQRMGLHLNIYSPYENSYTVVNTLKFGFSTSGSINRQGTLMNSFNGSTSFDGIKFSSPGTMSGTVRVYGYKDEV